MVFIEVLLIGLLSLGVSAVFYWRATQVEGTKKWLGSAHGILFYVALLYAILVSPHTSFENHDLAMILFFALHISGVVSIVYSLAQIEVYRWLCCLHLINMVFFLAVAFVGVMAISHDWL